MGFFDRLKQGLSKTRESLNEKLDSILKFTKTIDEETFEELEELLISADVGVNTTLELIERLRNKSQKIKNPDELKVILKEEIISLFRKKIFHWIFQQ